MLRALLLFCGLLSAPARAASSFEVDALKEKHHVTADRTLYHSRERVYEAFGHVVLSAQGQRLSSDYLWLDTGTHEIKVRGNVLLVQGDTTIEAAELHFNLDTGIGSIFYGKVSNDFYTLKGQLIRRVSADRFLVTDGEYTTCKDCAESWKLSARNVDLTVEGYAYLDNVFVKIKDVPTVFLPYLVVPVKTKRQSGFLFPRIGANPNNHGFIYVQPFYWAISPHQDATIAVGRYSGRGMRFEAEHRYQGYDGTRGQLDVFHTTDRKFRDYLRTRGLDRNGNRTAIISNNEWPVNPHLQLRGRVYEIFDRDYPLDFPEDISGRQLSALESNAVVSSPWDNFFASLEAKRYRNLLTAQPAGFDTSTVQALPTAHFGVKPVSIAGPLMASFYGRFDRFARDDGPVYSVQGNQTPDGHAAYTPGSGDFLRKANRLILSPEISAPFRLGSFLNVGPSLTYNEIAYDFSAPMVGGGTVPNTHTRYVQARLELSATLEKTYDWNSARVSKVQHQIVPFLTLSSIPWLQQGTPGHPFNGQNGQIDRSGGIFDQFDRVPYTNNTDFLRHPQGKSIYYGFTSRLVRRLKRPEEMAARAYPYDLVPTRPKVYPPPLNRKMELAVEREKLSDQFSPHYNDYQEVWTLNVSQAYDFIAAEKQPDKKRAFSYLLAKSSVNLDNFQSGIEYRFFPRISSLSVAANASLPEVVYSNKSFLTASLVWYLQNLTNLRKTRSFVRALEGYFTIGAQPNPSRTIRGVATWSLNDFASAKIDYSFDLLAKNQLDWSARLVLTHPSECWGVMTSYNWIRNRGQRRGEVGLQLLLNLTGTGFLGGDQIRGVGAPPAGVFGGT